VLGRLRELIQEGIPMGDVSNAGDLVEVVLDAVRAHAPTGQHVLLLRERAGERVLAVWVGPSEANAAALRLNDMTPARPLTHDLLAALVERTGAAVERVVITHQAEEVFYATVHLRGPAGPDEIDARPSDAINLALRTGAPILVAAGIMAESARVPDPESEPGPPAVSAMAVEAGTGQDMGLVHVLKLPEPGDQVAVHAPTGWRVVSVEPAEGDRPPRIVVRRPSAE
jgi:bifunctional DNase/RNase